MEDGSDDEEFECGGCHCDGCYCGGCDEDECDGSCDCLCSHCSTSDDSFALRSVRRRYSDPIPATLLRFPFEDRISKLSDSTLTKILSFLPLTDAIATATLSKRWRFLWKKVPNLVFTRPGHHSTSSASSFVSFVDKVLLLHDGSPINKFSVGFDYIPKFGSAVDSWLQIAIGKNVEEINLDFHQAWGGIYSYTLPQPFYTSSSLVKLTLRNCNIKPSAGISWPSLKTLSIEDHDELPDDLIKSIFSGSPVLESLKLRDCCGIIRLNIKSARLKKILIHRCRVLQILAPGVESLKISGFTHRSMLVNLPSLLHATLNFELIREEDESFTEFYRKSGLLITYLLRNLNHVQGLTVGSWCIMVLSALEVTKLTFSLPTVKHLTLKIKPNEWEHRGIACLLRNLEFLETLVIIANHPNCREIKFHEEEAFRKLYKLDEKNYWNSEEAFLNSLLHLKTVKIIECCESSMQSWFILEPVQILLKNSRVLEKVVIYAKTNANFDSLNSLDVAQKLLSFPRASPNAVILFHKS